MLHDTLQSTSFTPESEPGKGDGQGWRLHKDGTLEISQALIEATMLRPSKISSDTVQAFREQLRSNVLGKPFHRAIDRELLKEEAGARAEADEALCSRIGALSTRITMPGDDVVLGNLDEYTAAITVPPMPETILETPHAKLLRYASKGQAQVGNATQSLEQLISHHNRMILEVEKIEGGNCELLILASQQFRTGEALLRELLRQVDTRDVDDGK